MAFDTLGPRDTVALEAIEPGLLEGALDAQAAFILVIVGLECGQASSGEGRIWSEANRARLVRMRIHELGADIEARERGPDEIGADPASLRFETPTAPPNPLSALAG